MMRAGINIVLIAAMTMPSAGGCATKAERDELQPGKQYKVIGPVYLSGIYLSLHDRRLDRKAAYAEVTAVQFSGPEVAFQRRVPVGTVITIIGPAPKRVALPFIANRYFIQLNPADSSIDLDITLQTYRDIEGSADGLNPKLFEPVR